MSNRFIEFVTKRLTDGNDHSLKLLGFFARKSVTQFELIAYIVLITTLQANFALLPFGFLLLLAGALAIGFCNDFLINLWESLS